MVAVSGSEDPAKGPLGKDRTWALRRGIERNWADRYCWAPAATRNLDPRIQMERPTLSHGPWRATQAPLTIGTLQAPDYPAFTMNTTTVEMGDRFLLANYRLPKYELGAIEKRPAS